MTISDEGRHWQIWERYPILGSKAGRNPAGEPCFDHTGYSQIQQIERLLAAAFTVKAHAGDIKVGQARDDREKLRNEFYELACGLEVYGKFLKDLAEEMKEVGTNCTRAPDSNA